MPPMHIKYIIDTMNTISHIIRLYSVHSLHAIRLCGLFLQIFDAVCVGHMDKLSKNS